MKVPRQIQKSAMSLARNVLAFVALAGVATTFAPIIMASGNEGPHGGDYVASQFIERGRVALNALRTSPANRDLLSVADRDAVAVAIERTPVTSVSTSLIDQYGFEVDALTVSDIESPTGKLIQLNRARWETLLFHDAAVYQLAFHEYLWVIGADDSNYCISSRLEIQSPSSLPAELDLAQPLVISDVGSVATYFIYATDEAGNLGVYSYVGGTGAYSFNLNPRRRAQIQLNGGVIRICYDRRLQNSISVESRGGVVTYCQF